MIITITPTLKDSLLTDLLSSGSMSVECDIDECATKLETSSDFVEAIYDQFEEMGFIKQMKYIGGRIIEIKTAAHDFYNHGGFIAQEEILKANIQKLDDELELLAKQLSPNLLDKASKISALGANILSVLTYFKS